jgi:DNA ligase-1
LKERLVEVQNLGGEGLMLRQPGSLYVGKRSKTLLKVKTFYDAEAKVIGYEAGKVRLSLSFFSGRCLP